MTIFDVLFLASALAFVLGLLAALVYALRGRKTQAFSTLRILGMCAAAYLVSSIAVSLFTPQRVIALGDPWCFDDWCLRVENVNRTPGAAFVSYDVGLRIFSTAGRVSQRAKGAWIYLIDDRGRRYSPDSNPSTVPLDTQLQPGESVITSRIFQVPPDARDLSIITGHGGPYCSAMNVLIIGASGCLFNKPAEIRLPESVK